MQAPPVKRIPRSSERPGDCPGLLGRWGPAAPPCAFPAAEGAACAECGAVCAAGSAGGCAASCAGPGQEACWRLWGPRGWQGGSGAGRRSRSTESRVVYLSGQHAPAFCTGSAPLRGELRAEARWDARGEEGGADGAADILIFDVGLQEDASTGAGPRSRGDSLFLQGLADQSISTIEGSEESDRLAEFDQPEGAEGAEDQVSAPALAQEVLEVLEALKASATLEAPGARGPAGPCEAPGPRGAPDQQGWPASGALLAWRALLGRPPDGPPGPFQERDD